MRTEAHSSRIFPMFRNLQVALLAQRTPNTPSEGLVGAPDRNLQTSANVEAVAITALNLTLLSIQQGSRSLLIGQRLPLKRSIGAERNLVDVMLGSAGGTGETHTLSVISLPSCCLQYLISR